MEKNNEGKTYYTSPVLEKIRVEIPDVDLQSAAGYAKEYLHNINTMRVYPEQADIDNLSHFDEPLSDDPLGSRQIIDKLHQYGSPATVAQSGGRYFGFVCGSIFPASLCAKWLIDTWDQNPAMYVMSPIGAKLESVCEKWLRELLQLPVETVAGFVSGSSTAILAALLAGRNYLLAKQGYDVVRNGLKGAPKCHIIVSEQAHLTVLKALSILGLGLDNIIKVPADEQGRICADKIPEMDENTLLVLQAGNVNSGAYDNFEEICAKARRAGAWIHIDGAFGLWAAASPKLKHLTKGIELADSWSTDGHKTMNSPYDSGIVLCRHKDALANAMHMTGSYVQLTEDHRDSMMFTMEMSRRARAAELWAVLSCLGRRGVAELVEELQAKAEYFADKLASAGLIIDNEICFNQVLARCKDDESTQELIDGLQASGVLWLGGSMWNGKKVMRISVCSYRTTYADIDVCVEEIKRLMSQSRD